MFMFDGQWYKKMRGGRTHEQVRRLVYAKTGVHVEPDDLEAWEKGLTQPPLDIFGTLYFVFTGKCPPLMRPRTDEEARLINNGGRLLN